MVLERRRTFGELDGDGFDGADVCPADGDGDLLCCFDNDDDDLDDAEVRGCNRLFAWEGFSSLSLPFLLRAAEPGETQCLSATIASGVGGGGGVRR